jgi:hypothetical protein
MAEADKSTVTETASKPGASARANSSVTHPGLGMSAQLAMWMVVVTLCLIALPKGLVDSLPWSAANKSHMQIKDQMRALETRADAAVAAANDANTSARAAAACLAVMASGAKQAKSCAAGVAVPAQTLNSAASAQADPLRPVADIAKMTLDASKDKYDSIKDANDKLFSVLAAMGALLAFLGFKGLDSFMTAKSEAEKAVVEAQKAQEEADKAAAKLSAFLDKAYQTENRAEINVSHGIALREMAAVYKQGWDLQNHDKKPLPPLPPSGIEQYRAYLSKALYYLDAALQNRDDLDDILILRAMGTQCNVHRRLGDHEMALAIARQIIATYPKKDDSAYYNAACYCSLIGQRWATTNESAPADFSVLALGYLREAIVLEPENKKEAMGDTDFTWLKSAKGEEFNELVK